MCRLAGGKYWSVLAKTCNCMRQKSHAFRDSVVRSHGEPCATSWCARVCPQPLRGRWCAVHKSEAYARTTSWRYLLDLFNHTFLKAAPNDSKKQVTIGLFDDDADDYSARQNRWACEAYEKPHGLSGLEFWFAMEIPHQTRNPAIHLDRWVESESKELGQKIMPPRL